MSSAAVNSIPKYSKYTRYIWLFVVSILENIDHVIIGSYCIHQVSMNKHGNEANGLAPAEQFHMPATGVSLSCFTTGCLPRHCGIDMILNVRDM